MDSVDLVKNPVVKEHGLDLETVVRKESPTVLLTGGGYLSFSAEGIRLIGGPAVVLLKYLGDAGLIIIAADEWERDLGTLYCVYPPDVARRGLRYRVKLPRAYTVGLRTGDYSSRCIVERGSRTTMLLPHAIDAARLHRVW